MYKGDLLYPGDEVPDDQVATIAARAGGRDAVADCYAASEQRRPVGRFPLGYDRAKRQEIAQWAAGHYGPRARLYMDGVARGYREAAALCRRDEAAERRRGSTLYAVRQDEEARAAEAERAQAERRRQEDEAREETRKQEEREREERNRAQRAAAEQEASTRRAQEERRGEEEHRKQEERRKEEERRRNEAAQHGQPQPPKPHR